MGLGEIDIEWRKDWEQVKRIAKAEHETKARALLQSQAEIVQLVGEFNLFYRTDDPEVEQMYRAAWMLTKGGIHGSAKKDRWRWKIPKGLEPLPKYERKWIV